MHRLKSEHSDSIPNTEIFTGFPIIRAFHVKRTTGIAALFLKPLGSLELDADISENKKKKNSSFLNP